MPLELTQIAIAVVRRGDEFLIGRRAANADLGGLWEFPGGKVEAGESSAGAAARECLEETGVAVAVGEPYLETQHTYPHAIVHLTFWSCTAENPTRAPAAPFRWVPRRQLAAYQFPEANRRVLEVLLGECENSG